MCCHFEAGRLDEAADTHVRCAEVCVPARVWPGLLYPSEQHLPGLICLSKHCLYHDSSCHGMSNGSPLVMPRDMF